MIRDDNKKEHKNEKHKQKFKKQCRNNRSLR